MTEAQAVAKEHFAYLLAQKKTLPQIEAEARLSLKLNELPEPRKFEHTFQIIDAFAASWLQARIRALRIERDRLEEDQKMANFLSEAN